MTGMHRTRLVVLTTLAVAAGCGGSTSTSPDTFWVDLDGTVTEYSARLDAIDADFVARSWRVPTDAPARARFHWETDLEIQDAYIDAWREYVDRLDGLEPPEGYPEAGENYATGLPEYFDVAIVDTERSALAALERYRELFGDVDDPEASMDLGEARQLLFDLEDALEEEWEDFADSADEVGHPIDDTIDVRLDSDMNALPMRSAQLMVNIVRATESAD